MGRARTRRVDCDVELLPFYSSATILAVVLILAVSSQFSWAGVAAEEKSPPLDQASLRYLPDGSRIVAQVDVEALLKCELGRQMAASNRNDGEFAPLDLELEQMERAVIGARAFAEGHDAQYVCALFCKQPVRQLAVTSPWGAERVAQHTVWTKPGKDSTAVCVVDDRIVLIGVPQILRAVLLRDGPAELPPALQQACKQLSGDAGATVTLQPTVEMVAKSFGIPDVGVLSERVDAINVEIDFGADLTMRVAAICPNEAAAQQLNGMGLAIWALIQSQGIDQQDPKIRRLLRSLVCHVEGPILKVSMDLPFEMISVANSATPNTIVPVQHFAAPTKFIQRQQLPASQVQPLPPESPPGTSVPSTSSPSVAMPYGAVPPPGVGPYSPPPTPGYVPYASPYGAPLPSQSPHYPGVSPIAVVEPRVLPVIELSDVIRLSEAGVDEEVVVRHLEKCRLEHVLTTDDLIQLTEAGVSAMLIKELMDLEDRGDRQPPPELSRTNRSLSPRRRQA